MKTSKIIIGIITVALLTGCYHAEEGITDYLLSQEEFAWQTEGGKNICVYQNLGADDVYPLYIWARCSEYSMDTGELEEHSGISIPAKIDYNDGKFSHTVPGSGTDYPKDIKKIFPEDAQKTMSFMDKDAINKKVEEAALEYFQQEFYDSGRAKATLGEIKGRWVSLEDPKSEVEFVDGVKIDYYDGEKMFEESSWEKEFEILILNDDTLVLSYLPRGNTLKYKKAE